MSRQRYSILTLVALITLQFFFAVNFLDAVTTEPKHEYEKPGFNEGHAYDGILPEETIDLFTGGLLISQQDFHINNLSGVDRFESMLTRRYSSKIFRQQIDGSTCQATNQSIDDEFSGQGWSVHFGRLWDWNQYGVPNGHPVLELPNGSRHVFSVDSEIVTYPQRMISRSGWILQPHPSATHLYDACSPGPDSVCIRFYTNHPAFTDVRGGREVLHAMCWYYAGIRLQDPWGHSEGAIFTYDRDAAGRLWPKEIEVACLNNNGPIKTTFNWDNTKLQPTMDSITFHVVGGQPVNYTYQFITQNGHILLDRSSTPEGRTYDYDYDPITNELIRITISMDSTIDTSDLVIEYVYATHTFPINPFFLSSACTRVITQKKVKKSDGSFDTWTYNYPTSSPHKVTVTDPKGNKREVTFQGYSVSDPFVWNVSNILRDETFEGSTSLISVVNTYDSKQVSTALDPEASSYDTLKIPILIDSTKTYSQTGQQTTTSYGTAVDYDRYGNPDFKIERNFDGSILRTTQYQYEYRDGDGNDFYMEKVQYVHEPSNVKVLNNAGQRVSEITYEYYDDDAYDGRFGALQDILTWDSESDTNVRTTYDYSWRRERDRIYQQTEGADWPTESWNGICNGRTFWWLDPMSSEGEATEAGALFQGELDLGAWVYTTIYGLGYLPATTMSYDLDLRLTQITPPSGDATIINYDDVNRKVSISKGISLTTESYDDRGRLSKRETNISSGVVSTQTYEYDALNNLTKQSEKTLNATPTTFIDKAYDAFNRVTSIMTADGLTTYSHNGPDVTITVSSELGPLVTTMKYDAAGRLIKVVEPNSVATTYAYDVMDRLIRICHNDNNDICDTAHTNKREFVYSSRGKLLSETHPESGTTTYKYDLRGRMIEKKLAGAATATLNTYDDRGRLLTIDYPNDPDVSFYYDGSPYRPVPGFETQGYGAFPVKQLTGVVDSTGTTLWTEFNNLGQLLKREGHLNGIANPVVLNYTYDTRGNLASIKYPSGQVVNFPRNDANAISQIMRQFDVNPVENLVNSVSYNAAFLPNNFSYANGVTLGITSDVRNRPDVMDSAGKLTLDYNYNARGLISSIATAQNGGGSQSRTITYDNLGRLTAFSANGPTVNYNFDIFGNLLSKTGALAVGPFTYTNNRIDGVSYSAPGNQLSANGKTLIYNEENRLVQVTGAGTNTSYVYDGNGNRVKSVDAITGKTKYFIYDDAGTLLAEMSQASGGPLYIDKEYINGPSGTLVTAALDEIPRDLKVFDLNGKNRVQWTPSSSCNVIGYNVYRSNTEFGTYTLLNTSGPVTTGFYDDGGFAECTLRYYKIKAVYSGGLEGAFSEPIGHWFLHQRSVLYNSPSPSPAPLTVTYTYNKGGGCGEAASNYSLNYGDGSTQNFGTSGTITHNYTTASSCYPFCVATLTVTWNNGVTSTSSVLTDMSNTVMQDENFTDGVANGYTVVNGTWAVNSGVYNGQNSGTSWAVSVSSVPCNNCVIRADGLTVNTTGSRNAYIIFSYVDSLNFRYAGFDVAAGRWIIGDVINGTATTRSFFAQTLASNTWYAMELRLDPVTKVATLRANGITRVMWAFSTLYSLPVGVGVRGGQSNFDNLKMTPPMIVTTLHQEDLSDGVANGYVPAAGTWSIVSGRYRGTIATATDAASVSPVAAFNSGIILSDIRVVTNNGWVLFDYVNATNFKFAGVDAAGDKWIIGDVINGVKANRAQATQVLNTNTVYPVKVLLEGATVTLINSNAIKVRYTFASLTARPVALGLRGNGTSDFDNIKVCTEAYPTGSVGNPPAIPPPTSTAGPADVAAFSYANPPFYYNLNDHLGSTRIISNASGTVTASFEYWPFGEVKSQTGCAVNNQKFTGKLFDNESGLQYFGARYLSNDLTRFTSVDPARSAVLVIPQSWNRYVYSLDDPINRIDPDGRADNLFTRELRNSAYHLMNAAKATGSALIYTGKVLVWTGNTVGRGPLSTPDPYPGLPKHIEKMGKASNPYGSPGKPDHQQEVQRQAKKMAEKHPNSDIVREKKIAHPDSNRRPDVQSVDPKTGRVEDIVEVERHPESSRNQNREQEYDNLKVPNETVPVPSGDSSGGNTPQPDNKEQ